MDILNQKFERKRYFIVDGTYYYSNDLMKFKPEAQFSFEIVTEIKYEAMFYTAPICNVAMIHQSRYKMKNVTLFPEVMEAKGI